MKILKKIYELFFEPRVFTLIQREKTEIEKDAMIYQFFSYAKTTENELSFCKKHYYYLFLRRSTRTIFPLTNTHPIFYLSPVSSLLNIPKISRQANEA